MKEKIYEMLQLQNELNNDTNGTQWRQGMTKNHKPINWKRCIYMESAELIDSFPWKHWKSIDASPDYENIKMELTDIWHFLMSYLLVHHTIDEAAKMIEETSGSKSEIKVPKSWDRSLNTQIDRFLDPFEELMALALIKSDRPEVRQMLLEQFFRACDAVGLSLDELYKLYIGKNALNQFRQEHGYKEGNYRKIWNGREDNEVLQQILKENPAITYSELIAQLARYYPTP